MSSSEKKEDSRKDNDISDDVSQNQFEKRYINLTRTVNENSTSYVIKLASENDRLHFSRSLEVSNQPSNQPPALFSQAPNIDRVHENTDVDSSQQLEGLPSCSQNNYHVSPRQHAEISSVSVLEDSDASEAKTCQKYMSPLSSGRKENFTSPPEQGLVSMIKSCSKKSNTPPPEKRWVGSEAVSPRIKRLRKTPENDSSKPGAKTESYPSNLSFSAPAKISCTSAMNLRIQQTEGAIQMNGETGYTHTPSIAKGRKINVMRSSSVQSEKAANDQLLPILISSITYLKEEKIDKNHSDSSIRTPTPFTEHLRSGGMHRRSASDGTLTSINLPEIKTEQKQSNSSVNSHTVETPFYSNLEVSKGFSPAKCDVKTPFPASPPRPAPNRTLSTINSYSGRSDRVMSEVTEHLPSNESPTSRKNPEIQMQRKRNEPLQQKSHDEFHISETCESRNPIEVVREGAVNLFPYLDIIEGQPSTSRHQPIVRDLSFALDQASASRNQPKMASRVNSPYIPATEGQASTSMGNIVNGSFSSLDLVDTSSGHPPTSDSPHTENAGERARDRFDPHSEYIVEARHLLQWVLKEITQFRGEVYWCGIFEESFKGISLLSTELERFYLSYKLAWFLANRGYNLWFRSLYTKFERNATTSSAVAFERLVSAVVRTLALTLGVGTAVSDFNLFLSEFSNLQDLYIDFLRDSIVYDVEDIQDEATRNRVKTMRKKFLLLRLLTLSAFRLLLLYVGENSNEESIQRFESLYVGYEEDRTFLRRDNF